MNIHDVYGGDYLKCVHLQGQDVNVQIASVAVEEVGDDKKRQVVLQFTGHERRLGLCKTNAEQIAVFYGDDASRWVGQWVTLWPDPSVSFGGKAVGGVRIRPVPPTPQASVAPPAPTTPPVGAVPPQPTMPAQQPQF